MTLLRQWDDKHNTKLRHAVHAPTQNDAARPSPNQVTPSPGNFIPANQGTDATWEEEDHLVNVLNNRTPTSPTAGSNTRPHSSVPVTPTVTQANTTQPSFVSGTPGGVFKPPVTNRPQKKWLEIVPGDTKLRVAGHLTNYISQWSSIEQMTELSNLFVDIATLGNELHVRENRGNTSPMPFVTIYDAYQKGKRDVYRKSKSFFSRVMDLFAECFWMCHTANLDSFKQHNYSFRHSRFGDKKATPTCITCANRRVRHPPHLSATKRKADAAT